MRSPKASGTHYISSVFAFIVSALRLTIPPTHVSSEENGHPWRLTTLSGPEVTGLAAAKVKRDVRRERVKNFIVAELLLRQRRNYFREM